MKKDIPIFKFIAHVPVLKYNQEIDNYVSINANLYEYNLNNKRSYENIKRICSKDGFNCIGDNFHLLGALLSTDICISNLTNKRFFVLDSDQTQENPMGIMLIHERRTENYIHYIISDKTQPYKHVGTALINYIRQNKTNKDITLNSSIDAQGFYKKLGFELQNEAEKFFILKKQKEH